MTLKRSFAAVIALGVLLAITLRIWLRMSNEGENVFQSLWVNYRFFTIWTNTLIGVACARIALGRPVSPQNLSGLLLSILIVAAVYHALLASFNSYVGVEAFVDTMVHTVIPAAFAVFWLACTPKVDLRFRDIPVWLILPLVYCVYAMTRGYFDSVYPYFFLNLTNLGLARTALNIFGLLIGFGLVAAIIVSVAKALSRNGYGRAKA